MDKIQVNQERESLVSQALEIVSNDYKRILNFSSDADVNSLKKYSRINLKKRKNLRKFLKNPVRYVGEDVWRTYLFNIILCTPIRRTLDYNNIGRQLLMVEELPQGAYAKYDCNEPNTNGRTYSKECIKTLANAHSNVTMTHNGVESKFKI